ncbi:MAG TPA: ribosome recycling factor [Mycoplasmatales bacterium]|jgi:ribosome recycling factor|nr:ribosome recycling factor [Mycoplasmatales bacterium]
MVENLEKLEFELRKDLESNLDNFKVSINKVRGSGLSLDATRQIIIPKVGKLFHIANLSKFGQSLIIEPFNDKDINSIIKSVLESNLGYKLDKTTKNQIYFSLLPFNEETKKKIILDIKKKLENAKVSIRQTRQKFITSIKKLTSLSSDEEKNEKNKLEKLVKDFEKKLVNIYECKSKEILE